MKKLLSVLAIMLASVVLYSCDDEEVHLASIPDKYAVGDSARMFWGDTPRLASPDEFMQKVGAECLKRTAISGIERFTMKNIPVNHEWVRCLEADDIVYTDSIYIGRCTLKVSSSLYGSATNDNTFVLLCRKSWDFPCMLIGDGDYMESFINGISDGSCIHIRGLLLDNSPALYSAIINKVCVFDRTELEDYIKLETFPYSVFCGFFGSSAY